MATQLVLFEFSHSAKIYRACTQALSSLEHAAQGEAALRASLWNRSSAVMYVRLRPDQDKLYARGRQRPSQPPARGGEVIPATAVETIRLAVDR